MLFTAMFDEISEGTGIFKTVVDRDHAPGGVDLLPLDADGCSVASNDMYLRIAGETGRRLQKAR